MQGTEQGTLDFIEEKKKHKNLTINKIYTKIQMSTKNLSLSAGGMKTNLHCSVPLGIMGPPFLIKYKKQLLILTHRDASKLSNRGLYWEV